MTFTLHYPDSRKRGTEVGTRSDAINTAYREADDHTVEVYEGTVEKGTLLARYERRAEPVMPPPPDADGDTEG